MNLSGVSFNWWLVLVNQVDGTAVDAVCYVCHGSIRTETDSGWKSHHLWIELFHDWFHYKRYSPARHQSIQAGAYGSFFRLSFSVWLSLSSKNWFILCRYAIVGNDVLSNEQILHLGGDRDTVLLHSRAVSHIDEEFSIGHLFQHGQGGRHLGTVSRWNGTNAVI